MQGFLSSKPFCLMALLATSMVSLGNAATLQVELFTGDKAPIGKVVFEDSPYGLLIKPNLQGLPPGLHGFHVHQNPDCAEKGMKAGGHLDPKKTNSHQGPYGQGHLGDLPVLVVDDKGKAEQILLAPRLTTKDIQGHAIMVHAGGDNYKDMPAMGGGGARIACGIVPSP